MKRCPTCGKEKALDEFHRDSTRYDERCFQCAECQCKWQSEYQKTPQGRELHRLAQARYRERQRQADA